MTGLEQRLLSWPVAIAFGVIAALIVTVLPRIASRAQERSPVSSAIPAKPVFPDDLVRRTTQAALRQLGEQSCGTAKCLPATGEEFANPPVSLALAREAMDAGADSAAARWCGVPNSERILLAFVVKARRVHGVDPRGGVLLSYIHGLAQFGVARQLAARGDCPEAMRRELQELAARTFNRS